MASSTVRVKGLQETVRAFNKLDRSVSKELQGWLKKAADPVVDSSRSKLARYQGSRPGTIRPRVRGASVFVQQGAKKVTGKRGDFGRLQQTEVLEPALAANEREVLRITEDALDRFTGSEF